MSAFKIVLDEPVVVATSPVGENRWGYHQFPVMTRLPDEAIFLIYSIGEDAAETFGKHAPAYVSRDGGATWRPHHGEPRATVGLNVIAEAFGGEFLSLPAGRPYDLDANQVALPEPVGIADVYGIIRFYPVDELPKDLQDYFQYMSALRWRPETKRWHTETVEYDMQGRLAHKRNGSHVLGGTHFLGPPVKKGGALLYADYHALYMNVDGSAPKNLTVSSMVSYDNGHSFRRCGTIAADPAGDDAMQEPALSLTAEGELVCVIRRTDQRQKPMCITRSRDDGRTWEPLQPLFEFGVLPRLLMLANGALVLSFGRPGVHLSISADGTGRRWSEPLTVLRGDAKDIIRHTCGYTALVPLSEDSFLIAYSDFLHRDSRGDTRKAILVRKARLAR